MLTGNKIMANETKAPKKDGRIGGVKTGGAGTGVGRMEQAGIAVKKISK
jgi:hypothetical protein